MTGALIRRRNLDTGMHGGKMVRIHPGVGWGRGRLHAKDRGPEPSPLRASEGTSPADTSISGFQPPEP